MCRHVSKVPYGSYAPAYYSILKIMGEIKKNLLEYSFVGQSSKFLILVPVQNSTWPSVCNTI